MKNVCVIFIGVLCFSIPFMAQETRNLESRVLYGPYLGRKQPGLIPEIFADNFFSTFYPLHSNLIFSSKGKEAYWSTFILAESRAKNHHMKLNNKEWTKPGVLPISEEFDARNHFLSVDDTKLFFRGKRYIEKNKSNKFIIRVTEKVQEEWSEPEPLDSLVNSGAWDAGPSVSRNGNLYFVSSRSDSEGMFDIYYSESFNGKYKKPIRLGDEINSDSWDMYPYVAPDESYLIFYSNRPGGFGKHDLYISTKKPDGTWEKATNLGSSINTEGDETFPFLTKNGRYLFFLREAVIDSKIFWVDAKIIDELRPDVLEKELIHLKGPYLGQKPPGTAPEIFAPGIVSTAEYEHGAPAFSPDGKELYWSVVDEKELRQEIRFMKAEREHWSKPAKVSFADARFVDGNPVFSPDGRKLYFTSNRPFSPGGEARGSELWIWEVERRGDGWSTPKPLDASFHQVALASAPSLSTAGTLFLTPWKGSGLNPFDIFYCLYQEGRYSLPVSVGNEINSSDYEAYPFIAADESYLIFESQRQGGEGKLDLYISFRNADGIWTKARSMGGKINSSESDRFPCVTPDGKYLFFASDRNGNDDYYWIDAGIINELRPKDLR